MTQDYSRTLKRDLDYQYQQWQEQINIGDINMGQKQECIRIKLGFDDNIKFHRDRLDVAILNSTESEKDKQEFKLLIEELDQFQVELNVNYKSIRAFVFSRYDEIRRRILGTNDEEQQGLTAQRIQQFEQFQADESFVDDQCVICMGDIDIGRNMMRLDCDGQHTFCQVCIEGWFAIKKTCPICRHVFQ